MRTRTWPYGTTRFGTVVEVIQQQRHKGVRIPPQIVLVDDNGEGHVLIGTDNAIPAKGDKGTLTFTKGGTTGGYWKFTKEVA